MLKSALILTLLPALAAAAGKQSKSGTGDDAALERGANKSTGRRTGRVQRWNCTEVYHHTAQGWRIIQTHWSWTKPQLATAQ